MKMSITRSLSQKVERMMNRILEWFLSVPIDPSLEIRTTLYGLRLVKGRDANDPESR